MTAALVELAAPPIELSVITEAWLGCVVNPEPGFRSLLGAAAPGADVHVARWAIAR